MHQVQTASRLVALRAELVSATTVAQCVPALAGLVELAGELGREGARPVLDEVLSYLLAARWRLTAAEVPGQPGEEETALLYLEAQACLLRDATAGPVSDLDNAIQCLRQLRALFPAGSDERAEAEASLASATLTRVGRPGGRLADLDEAGPACSDASLDRVPPGSPARRQVVRCLAVQRGLRFISFGGTEEDRVTAIAYARECFTPPSVGPPDEAAAGGHLMIAWLTLTRQLTADQRSVACWKTEIETARHDGEAAAELLRCLGECVVAPDDARAALGHLRQVPAELVDSDMRNVKSMLTAMALLTAHDAGPGGDQATTDDLRDVADELRHAADRSPADGAELLTARAALLALRARASGDTDPGAHANEALYEAASRIPAGHPVRNAVLSLLGSGLGDQVSQAESAADPVAGLDEVIAGLDRMPTDDPEFARLMATVAIAALGLGLTRRSVAVDDRIAVRLDRAAAGLAPDDPLREIAEIMSLGSTGLRAAMRQDRDTLNETIDKLCEKARSYPAGDPSGTLARASLGFALCERHTMHGEIRDLEEADRYVREAFEGAVPGSQFADAARDPGTGHYACQDAVFSYAVSARQFIDATWCTPRSWGERPVLISDEKQSDRTSAAGIRALHAEHYPAGAVYGYARGELPATVPGEPVASSAAVLEALPGSGAEGASMLHLGCHGRAAVPVLHSSIRLGGANLLQVADILGQARAWRSRQLAVASTCGLVVLASCLSDVTDADYDEALLAPRPRSCRWRGRGGRGPVAGRHGGDRAPDGRVPPLPQRGDPWPRELRDLVEQADDPDTSTYRTWSTRPPGRFAYQGR